MLAALLYVAAGLYRSATADAAGQLHIRVDSGREILPEKVGGQVGFGSPAVSADGLTAGWLVLYEHPEGTRFAPIAGELALYRGGRVVHRFATEPVCRSWRFRAGGRQVEYCTGPTHGDASECTIRDVVSGRVLRRWQSGARSTTRAPDTPPRRRGSPP